MKKIIISFCLFLIFPFILTGCSDGNDSLSLQKDELISDINILKSEISELETEKELVKSEIVDMKEKNGTAKYVITFEIKQTHVSLSLSKHLKDDLNKITVDIPVDKEYYESFSIGDVISNEFRMGSFIMRGSFGNWKITVADKFIV